MNKLETVKRISKKIVALGFEAFTSIMHLIAILPKLFSYIVELVFELDTIEEWTELVLNWFRTCSKKLKK